MINDFLSKVLDKKKIIVVSTLIVVSAVIFFHSFFNTSLKTEDPLTKEERAWLTAHDGKIRMAPTPHWAPIEFIDDQGRYHGLAADYIHLIERNLNFKIKLVLVNSWAEVVEKAKKREIDIFASAMKTKSRSKYMRFTKPYLDLPDTIISHKSEKRKLTLDKMQGMKIIVAEDYAVNEYLEKNFPDLNIITIQNELIGLNMISFREADAMISSLPYTLHAIEKAKITNLRIAGVTDHVSSQSIATRKDWPLLHSIMEKGLAQITPEQRKAIYKKWIRIEPNKFYYNKTFLYAAASTFCAILLISAFTLAWNRILKIKVNQRTEDLQFNEMRLEALVNLNEMQNATKDEVTKYAFKEAVRLTKSRFGFFSFSFDNGKTFDSVISYANHQLYHNHSTGFPLDSIGLWGDALRVQKPVVSNCYKESNPFKKGIPDGCSKIIRYMNVPIFYGDKIVALGGVGNKKDDYNESDVRQLQLLSEGLWRLLHRRQSEKALKTSEQRFRNLVEFSLSGITIIQKNKCVYRNPAYEQIIGSQDCIFANKRIEIIHPGDVKKFNQYYDSTITGPNQAMDIAFRFYLDKKNNMGKRDLKWMYCRTHTINYQGIESVMVNVIDVTSIKKLEHLLNVQDKMASLGYVAAGIAHEIRNPLSGINIYISALENIRDKPKDSEQIQEIIEELRSASGKIESVIRRVMDFSKPIKPKPVLIDIRKPIAEAVTFCAIKYEKYGITIKNSVLTPNLPKCYVDPQLIEEVLLNLINNAAHAIKDIDTLKLIKIATSSTDDTIKITVSDSGPGLSQEIEDRIFEPFQTSKSNSTGIGLSICQRIITDHGGLLVAGNHQRGGAEFKIELPIKKKDTMDSIFQKQMEVFI